MSTWDEDFVLCCPVFRTELQSLRECSVGETEGAKEWLRKRSYLEIVYDQLKMDYDYHFGEIEQDLMRAALQRMHVVLNSTKDRDIRVEESKESISAIFVHVSTHLASCFEQFVRAVADVRNLLEEARSESIRGG